MTVGNSRKTHSLSSGRLGGNNWQDRDKADKVSILFPRDCS